MSFVDCRLQGTSLTDLEQRHFSESMHYSPSKQYAMIRMRSYQSQKQAPILFVDILNRVLLARIRKPIWKMVCYAYWLSDNVISLFSDSRNGYYIHFVYKCIINKKTVKLRLIQKRHIPFDNQFVPAWGCHQDSCKLTVNGHDFLFVKGGTCMLTAYNPLKGPVLPALDIDIATFVYAMDNNRRFYTDTQHIFASYNNSIYIYLSQNAMMTLDQFIRIDLVDFNLETRKLLEKPGHLDHLNPNVIRFTRLTEGSYTIYNERNFAKIWQSGHMAIIYESIKRKDDPLPQEYRPIVVVNLKNETVMEKKVTFEFTHVTLYNGFLLFWNSPDSAGKLSFKFEWLGDNIPKLTDICTVKLLSQPVRNKLFKQLYKNIISN